MPAHEPLPLDSPQRRILRLILSRSGNRAYSHTHTRHTRSHEIDQRHTYAKMKTEQFYPSPFPPLPSYVRPPPPGPATTCTPRWRIQINVLTEHFTKHKMASTCIRCTLLLPHGTLHPRCWNTHLSHTAPHRTVQLSPSPPTPKQPADSPRNLPHGSRRFLRVLRRKPARQSRPACSASAPQECQVYEIQRRTPRGRGTRPRPRPRRPRPAVLLPVLRRRSMTKAPAGASHRPAPPRARPVSA